GTGGTGEAKNAGDLIEATVTLYVYVAATDNCPSDESSFTVTINDIPMVNAGSNKTITCTDETVILNGSASIDDEVGLSYLWNGPGGFTSSILNPEVGVPGIYTLTVSTINGEIVCSASDSVQVTQDVTKPIAVLTAEATELSCSVTSIVLDASDSTGGDKFLWKGGETTSSITVNEPGSYYVIVTKSSNGCSAVKTITITQDNTEPEVIITGNEAITCSTTSITLDASSSTVQGEASYSWSDGSEELGTGATLEVTTAGDYSVTVT
ncbi:hypothetical protein, partial [Lutibacter oceani]|uniref:hypothetical protein n=1 Tax=Lutibacter oceani TaxID=1853311 RepID=UPI0013C3607A